VVHAQDGVRLPARAEEKLANLERQEWAVEQSARLNIKTQKHQVIAGLTFFHYLLVCVSVFSAGEECSADSTRLNQGRIHTRIQL